MSVRRIIEGSRALYLGVADDSTGVSFDVGIERSYPAAMCPALLPDQELKRPRPFIFGATTSEIATVCWLSRVGERVSGTETLPIPADSGRRAFVMPLEENPDSGGELIACGHDGDLVWRTVYQSAAETQRAGEDLSRFRAAMSEIGRGPMPGSGEWVLSAGFYRGGLAHWIERLPHGGGAGSGGAAPKPEEVIRLQAVSGGAEDVQTAVGQVAKHAEAAQAVLDDGSTESATIVRVPELPVDFVVALARPPRAVRRLDALDVAGRAVGRASRSSPPDGLPEQMKRNVRW